MYIGVLNEAKLFYTCIVLLASKKMVKNIVSRLELKREDVGFILSGCLKRKERNNNNQGLLLLESDISYRISLHRGVCLHL